MASTWNRDNQALFPVKQSCCFSSSNRKTQQQQASSFTYRVTFVFREAENKTTAAGYWVFDVQCLKGCCFKRTMQCHTPSCVISVKCRPNPYLIIQMRYPPLTSPVVSLHLIFDSLDFPFYCLLI